MLDSQLKLDRAFKKMNKNKQRFLQKLMNNIDVEHIDSSKMYFLKQMMLKNQKEKALTPIETESN